ncbi:clustered-asparagine-rich protein, putative [Plasmodium gallinaceum]|uniref:Clustered-asparagine-rich protein, putative n=1 Tax=Plasmodium gallinaceum TaxID=5849 RepID=A0A1J1GXH6_PLAGA|nr:clustered-asparagine-rich protein, putative [Plasmodium gallinaceum]CRG96998.1 clustered-asparagine-rich protein, putative [Plasmodium gallinaceum]
MSNEILNSTIDGVLNTRLHIQNIPPHITDVHLRSLLGNVGYIKDICYFNKNKKQMNNFTNKKIYNTALITFNTHEEALNVLKNIRSLIDTTGEERSIEAKFAVPNVNNNFFHKNNMNANFPNNYQNNFNNENFSNNMNNYNFYNNNNNSNSQNNFMNRNVKNKNINNMVNMNMNNQVNNPMANQNNFMFNNNNYNGNKNMNEMIRESESPPNNNNNNNNALYRQNNSQVSNSNNVYQTNDNSLDENENTEGLSLWEIYKDKNNNTFYYNNLTKHSQWNKPIHPNKLFQYNNNEKTKQNGPNGSNLFIFHIPSEWSDLDLFQHFCCFGNIISSKIQRDNTGRNSGFGFVSYDNIMSAHHAIQFMNGYYVNNKYLKVQLKKGEAMEKVQA